MKYELHNFRTLRILPALLLAVFISTQIGLVGHLHADDSTVADCLQCQFDNGQAAAPGNCRPAAIAGACISTPQPVAAAPSAAIYNYEARGPPLLFPE